MATAKQRAWRVKFARLYGNKGGVSRKARKTRRVKQRGVRMARRRFGRKRSGGMGGIMKPLLVGTVIGMFGDSIPIVGGIEPMATGAVGGFMMKKSLMGAGAGAAGGYIGSRYLKGMMGDLGSKAGSGTIYY
jgi:hypothetical protein